MKKHKFNIFPEAKDEDYGRLLEDIRANGYDQNQPVILYQGDILDGWNRTKACAELGITPPSKFFDGDDNEAVAFVMRSNKRRNLNSGQWATVAVEAEEIVAALRSKNGRPNINESKTRQKIADFPKKDERKTAHKVAEVFNTNRTYVTQAAKIKAAAPEVFEKVKAGKMTMQDASRAVRAIPTEPWLKDEISRKLQNEDGDTVVANTSRDKNLIQWAEQNGKAVRVDRGSDFGNPFLLDADGTRDEVCDAYRDHYLPHKKSITAQLPSLRGKVLICHCYPERCHAEALIGAL